MSKSVYISFKIFKNPRVPANHTNQYVLRNGSKLQSISVSLTHYFKVNGVVSTVGMMQRLSQPVTIDYQSGLSPNMEPETFNLGYTAACGVSVDEYTISRNYHFMRNGTVERNVDIL